MQDHLREEVVEEEEEEVNVEEIVYICVKSLSIVHHLILSNQICSYHILPSLQIILLI